MYSSRSACETMLEAQYNFKRPQPLKVAMQPAFLMAWASSSSCCLSFQVTIFDQMTCQKPLMSHLEAYSTIKNDWKLLIWLGHVFVWPHEWHHSCPFRTEPCHRMSKTKKPRFLSRTALSVKARSGTRHVLFRFSLMAQKINKNKKWKPWKRR